MAQLKNKKDQTYLFVGISVGIIFLGILASNIIDRTKPADFRAAAGTETGVSYVGVLLESNQGNGTITLGNVYPKSNPKLNYGEWTVTAPSGYNFAEISPGTFAEVTADPKSVYIDKRVMTAKKIVKGK